MSTGKDHCEAVNMNNSVQDSSNKMAWSRKGSERNDGIFLAHLIDINNNFAAVSYIPSSGWTGTCNPFSGLLLMLFCENRVDMLKRLLLGKNFGVKLGRSCADVTTVDVTSGLSRDFRSGVAEIHTEN